LGASPNIDGKIILLAVLTIVLVFTGVSFKFNSIIVDVVVVLLLLVYTAVENIKGREVVAASFCKKEENMLEDILEFIGRYVIKPIISLVRYLVIEIIIEGIINGIRKLRDKWRDWRERRYWR
jgi:hypothetical protein